MRNPLSLAISSVGLGKWSLLTLSLSGETSIRNQLREKLGKEVDGLPDFKKLVKVCGSQQVLVNTRGFIAVSSTLHTFARTGGGCQSLGSEGREPEATKQGSSCQEEGRP